MNKKATESIAIETLNLAAQAILSIAQNLPANFGTAINELLSVNHLIITTGVGKSGFIAQKMAATLTSTGSPSVFLDPLNALHGDLGIVGQGDVLIAFSNSGESKELLALIPTLKQRHIPLIAIVGKTHSSLGQAAQITLEAAIEREACPLNLAPTTSTTVAMALADALAVSLMCAKNYSAEDFALNHPAGSLGRRLTLRIYDLLPTSINTLYLDTHAIFSDIVCKISASGTGAICITDPEMNVLGIITDGDIRRTVEKQPANDLPHLKAEQIMTKNPVCIQKSALAIEALNTMEQRSSQISVLPVVDQHNKFQGIIRLHDLIRAGL